VPLRCKIERPIPSCLCWAFASTMIGTVLCVEAPESPGQTVGYLKRGRGKPGRILRWPFVSAVAVVVKCNAVNLRATLRQYGLLYWALRCSFFVKLIAVTAEHKEANSRREVVVFTRAVDLGDQLWQRHVATGGDLLQSVPKCIFEADAKAG
jgi:hypothetical protein